VSLPSDLSMQGLHFNGSRTSKNFTNSAHSRDFYHLPYICGLFMCTVCAMDKIRVNWLVIVHLKTQKLCDLSRPRFPLESKDEL